MTFSKTERHGLQMAIVAYASWGVFPVFWRLLSGVSFSVIISHRIFWSWVFFSVYCSWKSRKTELGFSSFRKAPTRDRWMSLICAWLLLTNWLLYIIAVVSGLVVESSLGYFLNPLVSVALGTFVLKESLTKLQKVVLLLACIGVLLIGISMGRPPWYAIILALTFGFYGFLKKQNSVSGIQSSQIESLLVLPVTFVLFVALTFFRVDLLGGVNSGLTTDFFDGFIFLHVLGGFVTGVPLILFAEALHRLKLSSMGFLQFISPSIQFVLGVVVVKEAIPPLKGIGFIFIWFGLLMLVGDGLFGAFFKKWK